MRHIISLPCNRSCNAGRSHDFWAWQAFLKWVSSSILLLRSRSHFTIYFFFFFFPIPHFLSQHYFHHFTLICYVLNMNVQSVLFIYSLVKRHPKSAEQSLLFRFTDSIWPCPNSKCLCIWASVLRKLVHPAKKKQTECKFSYAFPMCCNRNI